MAEAAENTNTVEFDSMPGADTQEAAQEQAVDLNFGLGEEPAPEPTAEEEPPVEETAEETEEIPAEAAEMPAEEPEIEPEPVAEEPEPAPKKPMVPKSRLDEVLAKQKALQKQLDDMRAAKEQIENAPDQYEFAEKELEYQNLVLDGEHDKAMKLRMEIRAAERAQLEFEMTQKMEQAVSVGREQTALQQAAADLEESFPVFDHTSSEYNEAYTQEVIDLRDAFVVKGDNPVAALSKAAKYVVREYGLDPVAADKPALSGNTAPQQDEVAKKRAEVSRKLKAAQAQPPEMAGESSSSRGEKPMDISAMTEDEFNALPEATLKRLRGDIY